MLNAYVSLSSPLVWPKATDMTNASFKSNSDNVYKSGCSVQRHLLWCGISISRTNLSQMFVYALLNTHLLFLRSAALWWHLSVKEVLYVEMSWGVPFTDDLILSCGSKMLLQTSWRVGGFIYLQVFAAVLQIQKVHYFKLCIPTEYQCYYNFKIYYTRQTLFCLWSFVWKKSDQFFAALEYFV